MFQACKWLLYPVLRCHICPLILPLLLYKLSLHLLWTFLKDRTQEAVRYLLQINTHFTCISEFLVRACSSTLPDSKEAKGGHLDVNLVSKFQTNMFSKCKKTAFQSKLYLYRQARKYIGSTGTIPNYYRKAIQSA